MPSARQMLLPLTKSNIFCKLYHFRRKRPTKEHSKTTARQQKRSQKDQRSKNEKKGLHSTRHHAIVPSLTVDEPMSARIPRDNGISGTFLIVLKTLYAGATSKVF